MPKYYKMTMEFLVPRGEPGVSKRDLEEEVHTVFETGLPLETGFNLTILSTKIDDA